jgi:hypothetical protein
MKNFKYFSNLSSLLYKQLGRMEGRDAMNVGFPCMMGTWPYSEWLQLNTFIGFWWSTMWVVSNFYSLI